MLDKDVYFIKIDDLIENDINAANDLIKKARKENYLETDVINELEVKLLVHQDKWSDVCELLNQSININDNNNFNLIFWYIQSLFKINKLSNAISRIEKWLSTTNHFFQHLVLLNLAQEYIDLSSIRSSDKTFENICENLGIDFNTNIPLEEKVAICKKENLKSNRKYAILLLEISDKENTLNSNKIRKMIKKYIEQERLKFYKNLAIDLLVKFQ